MAAIIPTNGLNIMVDMFRLTTNLSTNEAEPISSNLSRVDDTGSYSDVAGNALINPGMTVSSGVFTFPSTGKYHVEFVTSFGSTSDERYVGTYISFTTNNGTSYYTATTGYESIEDADSSTSYAMIYSDCYLDITDTANDKVRFNVNAYSTTLFVGDAARDYTYMTFTRVGDT